MNVFNWSIFLYIILRFFVIEHVGEEYVLVAKIGLSILGVLLILWALKSVFISGVRALRDLSEIISKENLLNCFKLAVLLAIVNLDDLGAIGIYFYIFTTLALLIFAAFIVVREFFLNRSNADISVVIVALIFIYLLFVWSKHTFVKNYGTEIVGDYWEKPAYKTKYFVKISRDREFKTFYTLPAQLSVFHEAEESEYPQEDNLGNEYFATYDTKYVVVERVFFDNGGFLRFEECNLTESHYCVDQNGRSWYIKLEEPIGE